MRKFDFANHHPQCKALHSIPVSSFSPQSNSPLKPQVGHRKWNRYRIKQLLNLLPLLLNLTFSPSSSSFVKKINTNSKFWTHNYIHILSQFENNSYKYSNSSYLGYKPSALLRESHAVTKLNLNGPRQIWLEQEYGGGCAILIPPCQEFQVQHIDTKDLKVLKSLKVIKYTSKSDLHGWARRFEERH